MAVASRRGEIRNKPVAGDGEIDQARRDQTWIHGRVEGDIHSPSEDDFLQRGTLNRRDGGLDSAVVLLRGGVDVDKLCAQLRALADAVVGMRLQRTWFPDDVLRDSQRRTAVLIERQGADNHLRLAAANRVRGFPGVVECAQRTLRPY